MLDGAANSFSSLVSEAVRNNHPREVQTVFDALPLNVGQFAHGSIAKLRVLRTKPNLGPDRERASIYGYMRLAWIDGPSREAPPSIPIRGLQEQHASGLVGDHRMCAQSVPVVESHLDRAKPSTESPMANEAV
jgi:hypothetical protein